MSAPLELKFEVEIERAIKAMGPMMLCPSDIKRVADVVGNIVIEVYGELGLEMVRTPWQREEAAKFILKNLELEKENKKLTFTMQPASWILP